MLAVAPTVTCLAVGVGVVASTTKDDASQQVADRTAAAALADSAERTTRLSRGTERKAAPTPTPSAAPTVRRLVWTRTAITLRAWPDEKAPSRGTVKALQKVGVTGARKNGYAQVIRKGKVSWAITSSLSKTKPVPASPAGSGAGVALRALPADALGGPCAGSAGTENGLVPGAVRVYRAVCHAFPELRTFVGLDPHGEHTNGRAIDMMTSDVALGNAIAAFLVARADEFGLANVIWRQRIWTPERRSEGWRTMPDRGSATANHYDHVHVSVR